MFESINSVSRNNMVRQTVSDGYYPVSEVEFSQVIVTVMLNQFIFITSSPNYRKILNTIRTLVQYTPQTFKRELWENPPCKFWFQSVQWRRSHGSNIL